MLTIKHIKKKKNWFNIYIYIYIYTYRYIYYNITYVVLSVSSHKKFKSFSLCDEPISSYSAMPFWNISGGKSSSLTSDWEKQFPRTLNHLSSDALRATDLNYHKNDINQLCIKEKIVLSKKTIRTCLLCLPI